MVLFKENKIDENPWKYNENKFVLTYSYWFYDTVSNLDFCDFCDFCEQGERSRCSQNSGNLVYLQYSHKTLYYFEFLNSLVFYLCPNTWFTYVRI